ncbi:hypothetical protein [Symbiobacterium thermophilum]|nr:hypothetical protein [Symbiobacterium thermophilum]
MDRTEELLRASFSRLEGLIGEVRDLRYKIKSVQGDVESLRAALGGGGNGNAEPSGSAEGEPSAAARSDGTGSEPGESGSAAAGAKAGPGDSAFEERLRRIEQRLDYLASKWLELDEKLFRLQKRLGSTTG